MTSDRLVLAVDGNSLVHRSFHAQAKTNLRDGQGRPIWAVRGLLMQLLAAVERLGPDAIVVGFDDHESSRRRTEWPQYKASRGEKLETLVSQLALAQEVLQSLGVAVVVPAGLEADDVLASTAHFARTAGARTVVMTSDRDSFCLIDDNTRVLRIINGGVEASPLLTPDRLVSMIGVRPEQYRDYAALRGDPSDNLPGVRGIGPKTAAVLLSAMGSARAAFDDIDAGAEAVLAAVGPGATKVLSDPQARPIWELNCRVMSMHTDLELGLDLSAGVGVLPLMSDAVREAFTQHQLTGSIRQALRVLANHESGEEDSKPGYAWSEERDSRGFATAPSRRPPRLSKPVVAVPAGPEQLSLFDSVSLTSG